MPNIIRTAMQLMVAALCLIHPLAAQSIISGDITGTATDPSGAVLPGASVGLRNVNTGVTQETATNSQGVYRFALLPPGTYAVRVTVAGFQTAEQTHIPVVAGQSTTANFQLTLAAATQSVEVTDSGPALQTQNADLTTTYNAEQILAMPNPGGDLSYIAQTAPGVVMNTQSGYGNFSADGMPATSNLFTINGQNFNDPYLNINNSGASNLTLGANDIAEGNVINNAYSAQYGQYAGSQVAFTTKSGTNAIHGGALWMWNGRYLNADDFFSNSVGSPRPFLNYNQWAAGAQGPIWKNHTFFDVDYEGVHIVLPTSSRLIRVPSPQFESATLANLAGNGNSAEIPFYQKIFGVYNNGIGIGSAVPVPDTGCAGFTGLGAGVPCALQFRTTPPNKNTEYQWASRVDHNFSAYDHGYIRLWRDNGFQPTYTSPWGPDFNAFSSQPQMSGQVSETHTFGATAVNQFNGSALFYSAVFSPSNPSAQYSALPIFLSVTGAPFSQIGDEPFFFPQGRRVFQYQIIDDFSKVAGKHTFRLGFSWLHDSISELGFGQNTQGWVTVGSVQEFFNGGGPNTFLQQNFPNAVSQGFKFNTYGGYLADDWKVTNRLNVSLNLRLESYGNPTCEHDCFSRLAGEFTGAAGNPDIPYNQAILFHQHYAYPNTQAVVWEPRVGIAWRPTHSEKTVIRTGAGIFADAIPGFLAQDAAFNPPGLTGFTIGNGTIAPGAPGSLLTLAAQANQAFLSQFASGGTLASIQQATNGAFAPPNVFNFPALFKQPTYYKWNLEVQQALGWNTIVSLNYNGVHGINIPISDNGLNGYCPPSACPNGFAGLPAAAPDPRFGTVTQFLPTATSNYNGLTVSLRRSVSNGLTFNANYTWSHALDMVSNGGLEQFNLQTNPSIIYPQDPHNIRANYGNADQDVRHYFSLGYVMTDVVRNAGLRGGPKMLFGGWTLSGNIFYRTGLPFTVIDNAAAGALAGFNYAGTIFSTPLTAGVTDCGKGAVNTPCLSANNFTPAGTLTGFGNQARNQYRGPGFFDMDLSLTKEFVVRERVRISAGAQAFNLLNHPNFDQPIGDVANPLFGSTVGLVGPPTSILGAFVGGNNSPRFVEAKAVLRF